MRRTSHVATEQKKHWAVAGGGGGAYGHCHERSGSSWLKLEWRGRGSSARRTGCRRSTRGLCCVALSGCPVSDSATCWWDSPVPVNQSVPLLLKPSWWHHATASRSSGLTFWGLAGTRSKLIFMPGMITVILRGPLNPNTLVSCQMAKRQCDNSP